MTAIVIANFLMFALLAAGIYAFGRWHEQRVTARCRKIVSSARRVNQRVQAENSAIKAEIERIDKYVRTQKGLPGFKPNLFDQMEDRHEAEALKNIVVEVNGEVVRPTA